MIVTDASVIAELLLQTPAAAALEERIFDPAETLHAPALLDVEVTQVLRRWVRAGQLSEPRARAGMVLLARLPVRRYLHEPLLARMWTLRASLTVYDAAYVALAEALDAPLVTRDARLVRSTGHRAHVELT